MVRLHNRSQCYYGRSVNETSVEILETMITIKEKIDKTLKENDLKYEIEPGSDNKGNKLFNI